MFSFDSSKLQNASTFFSWGFRYEKVMIATSWNTTMFVVFGSRVQYQNSFERFTFFSWGFRYEPRLSPFGIIAAGNTPKRALPMCSRTDWYTISNESEEPLKWNLGSPDDGF